MIRVAYALMGVVLLLGLVVGCGFHLRGSAVIPAPLLPIHVSGQDNGNPLVVKLRESLSRQQALAENSQYAQTSINVESDNWFRRVLSVDEAGRALAYEMQYQLVFSIHSESGLIAIDRASIKLHQEYGYDVGLALAKTAELTKIREQLYADAAYLVLQRLRKMPQ